MIRKPSAGTTAELAWFKSSYSSGPDGETCVEVALDWFKSSYSDGPDGESCVEIAATPTTIHVRDSKHADDSPRLALSPEAWTVFVPSV
ncbi:DUF397 domain-containing protein [Streptomyces sp. NBC_01485]|uniref:DUF397 domain-containing protein n=1 Tax=Streptomyces sp. NBC_01485 TaxID=2903884 RepID=UPI002E37B3C5|nr:DUF397 domain-containing protein [Streptomyces sp. NBC_01485]